MPFGNALDGLFGKSPIKPIQEHMRAADAAAKLLTEFMKNAQAGDWEKATELRNQISKKEQEADDIKRNVRMHLPKSLFMPVPRGDLLELISAQDHIANTAKIAAGVVLGRKMQFPESIRQEVIDLVETAEATSHQAMTAIDELDELLETSFAGPEAELVQSFIRTLDELETRTDKLQFGLRQKLFDLEKDLPPVDVIFMYRTLEWIGKIADEAQRVGNRLQMLVAK